MRDVFVNPLKFLGLGPKCSCCYCDCKRRKGWLTQWSCCRYCWEGKCLKK